MTSTVVVMTSGGMDSTVLCYWAEREGYEVLPLFINYGQHCAVAEREALESVLPVSSRNSIRTVNLSSIFAASQSRLIREANLWQDSIASADLMLPYRNLVLLTAGSAFAASVGCRLLFSAFINSNHALEVDATNSFLSDVARLMGQLGGVELSMPFRNMTKAQVAAIGIQLGVPISETYSCQANSKEHCGSCPNCVERLNAFQTVSKVKNP